MNHLTTARSTPLDNTRTSKVHNHTSAKKSKSGTSFSLKDQLRSLRQKSTPSSSTTHNVTLSGLKSDRQVRGNEFLPSRPTRSNNSKLTRPPQTRQKTDHRRTGITYTRPRLETFVLDGCSSRRVLAFAIADPAPSRFGYFSITSSRGVTALPYSLSIYSLYQSCLIYLYYSTDCTLHSG